MSSSWRHGCAVCGCVHPKTNDNDNLLIVVAFVSFSEASRTGKWFALYMNVSHVRALCMSLTFFSFLLQIYLFSPFSPHSDFWWIVVFPFFASVAVLAFQVRSAVVTPASPRSEKRVERGWWRRTRNDTVAATTGVRVSTVSSVPIGPGRDKGFLRPFKVSRTASLPLERTF